MDFQNQIINPTHENDWYLRDYERPDNYESWEHFEAKGREEL